jgi:hypothetical protein
MSVDHGAERVAAAECRIVGMAFVPSPSCLESGGAAIRGLMGASRRLTHKLFIDL